ncbi:MAG: hypothetical protein WCG08_13805 [Paludibacter sp.]
MKKKSHYFLTIVLLIAAQTSAIQAADVLLRLNPKPGSTVATYTFSTTDVLYAVDAATMSGSTSNTVFPSPNNARVQLKTIVLELKSTSASAITVWGESSGSTSTRTIFQVSVADSYAGTYTLLDDVTLAGTKITSNITGQPTAPDATNSKSTVTGLNIPKGKFVKISFCTGTSGGATQNINISGFDITPGASYPGISAFSVLGVPATINETVTPATITATLPYGTSLAGITPTLTLSGSATSYTPTGAQDFSAGAVNYTATDGTNNTVYAVTLSVAASIAAPVITTPTNNNQWLKASSAITDIAFTLQNSIGATITGLPTGLNAVYNNGTYTISGTVDASVTPGNFNYTITATAIVGYTGSDITASGSIAVKNINATNILYLATEATAATNDLFLAQLLSKSNYFITKRAAQASFTGNYDAYDLIVLHESLTGGDAATVGHELNLIKSVDKPILNTKSYFYTSGTSARWGWGTPTNGNSGKGIITVQASHPIFSGISVSDSLYIYNTLTSKNVQPVNAVSIGGYQIAKVAGGIAIHDLPASIRLGAGKTSKYLMISLLSGKYNDLSADGLKLLDNAVQYLLSGTQFAAPSLEITSFKVDTANASIIHNPATISLLLAIGADLSALQPTIVLSGIGTTLSPASGVANDFTNSVLTPINYTVTDGINSKVYATSISTLPSATPQLSMEGIYFDGQIVHNENQTLLQVYNSTGILLATSTQNINTNQYKNGIYLIKCHTGCLKIAFTR